MQEGFTKMDIPGIIVIWSGSIVNIPTGWVICDGNNGTPDLRNNFVVGAGDTYAVDAAGGSVNHNHAFTGDGHTHELGVGVQLAAGPNFGILTNSANVTGTTDNGSSLPPYYALAFIMKT